MIGNTIELNLTLHNHGLNHPLKPWLQLNVNVGNILEKNLTFCRCLPNVMPATG